MDIVYYIRLMNDIETQVAKIQIGDIRQANTYVHVVAEKVDVSETELYALTELPVFNPAAQSDCERISEAIAASLCRSYRGSVNSQTFENALASINEDLGKLANIGKTHWIGNKPVHFADPVRFPDICQFAQIFVD